jgi:hypothetical protein
MSVSIVLMGCLNRTDGMSYCRIRLGGYRRQCGDLQLLTSRRPGLPVPPLSKSMVATTLDLLWEE